VPAEEIGDAHERDRRAAQVDRGRIPHFPLSCPCRDSTPLTPVLEMTDGKAELWMGSQFPSLEQADAGSRTLGIDPSDVRINVMFAGAALAAVPQHTSPMSAAESRQIAKVRRRKLVHGKLLWDARR